MSASNLHAPPVFSAVRLGACMPAALSPPHCRRLWLALPVAARRRAMCRRGRSRASCSEHPEAPPRTRASRRQGAHHATWLHLSRVIWLCSQAGLAHLHAGCQQQLHALAIAPHHLVARQQVEADVDGVRMRGGLTSQLRPVLHWLGERGCVQGRVEQPLRCMHAVHPVLLLQTSPQAR